MVFGLVFQQYWGFVFIKCFSSWRTSTSFSVFGFGLAALSKWYSSHAFTNNHCIRSEVNFKVYKSLQMKMIHRKHMYVYILFFNICGLPHTSFFTHRPNPFLSIRIRPRSLPIFSPAPLCGRHKWMTPKHDINKDCSEQRNYRLNWGYIFLETFYQKRRQKVSLNIFKKDFSPNRPPIFKVNSIQVIWMIEWNKWKFSGNKITKPIPTHPSVSNPDFSMTTLCRRSARQTLSKTFVSTVTAGVAPDS